MGKKYYEFWGHDSFQRETFFIAICETKEEAEKALAEANEEALSQDIAVRDRYWIIESTLEELIERKKRHVF
jgi:hypothetical protein